MKNFWDRIFNLDREQSIWIEEKELGTKKAFYHKDKRYFVKIPEKINKKITLRLRGFGKTRFRHTGDLFLHVWLNKGEDITTNLWLSETAARHGAKKRLRLDEKVITIVIPPKSYNGLTLRLTGYGREGNFEPQAPYLDKKKRGNALVKLIVYPDKVKPRHQSFETLSTDSMFLEGWVYRKFDEVVKKIGKSSFPPHTLRANIITHLFNEFGWRSIFDTLVERLKLSHCNITLTDSASIAMPGLCERKATYHNNQLIVQTYTITINQRFLDNPFAGTAILAHELCHVVYAERIAEKPKTTGFQSKPEKATLEEERTVDLLVFMYKLGEFQLRIARDQRLTLGYFNQDVFDRMQVIVAKKMNSN